MNSDKGAEVALGVLVGVEISWEARLGQVLNGADVLNVSGVFALAAHPHGVQLLHGHGGNVLPERRRHFCGQGGRVIVEVGHPVVNLLMKIPLLIWACF